MKHLATTSIFLFFTAVSGLLSQGNMYPEIQHYGQIFTDIKATDSDVTAAGDNIILNSKDNGNTWQEIKLPTNAAYVKHVARIADGHYLAAGRGLFVTTDDGKEWIINEDLNDITSVENYGSTIFLTRQDEDDRFMRSDDGGLSWVSLSTSNAEDPQNLNFINTSDAFFSDINGTIYYSFNGGLSWEVINDTQFSEPIGSIQFETVDHGYAQVGDLVYETTDAGASWTEILDSFIASDGLFLLSSGLYTYSGSSFGVYVNNGISYVLKDDDIDEIFSLDIAEGNGYLYVTGSGMITNHIIGESFEEWTDLTPGPNDGFNGMIIRDQDVMVAGGRRLELSNDGGSTFRTINTGAFSYADMDIAPDGNLYVIRNTLYRSTNDGQDFEYIIPGIKVLHIFEDGRLLTAGTGSISQSLDNAESFDTLYSYPSTSEKDFYFFNDNLGWFMTGSGTLYRTQDGGVTWSDLVFPFGSSPSAMHFINPQIGYAVRNLSDRFWKTTDGGDTWEELNFPLEADLTGVYFQDEMTGYVVGREKPFTEGIVLKTEDGGNTWTLFQKGIDLFWGILGDNSTDKFYVFGMRGQLLSFKSCDDLKPTLTVANNTITCNESSEFYKWFLDDDFLVETTDPFINYVAEGIYTVRIIGAENCISDFSEGIDAIVTTQDIIDEEKIHVFPNPSSGLFTLELDPDLEVNHITIYNLAGKEIYQQKGISRNIDLSHLPKGQYFIRMQMHQGYGIKKITIR